MVIVPAPDVILLAKVNDDGGEMGRQIVADEDLDLIFWQKPDVWEEHLQKYYFIVLDHDFILISRALI
jgi:hypothetical protein